MNRGSALASVAVWLLLGAAGCTEDPILADSTETAPGFATPTIEIVLESGELPDWRDTTYWGFVVPNTASFNLIADREDLQARPLGRFAAIPDSVFVENERVAIESFSGAVVRVAIDTALSDIPAEGAELAVWTLARSFDADEATWQLAGEGDPWSVPGGDLGVLLGADSVGVDPESAGVLPDSARVTLDVNVDSLLTAWRDADGEPGFALVLSGPGGLIRANTIALVMEALPEGQEAEVSVVRGALPGTFVFDPPTPEPTTRLRLAGLPAARYYVDFSLPDSLGLIPLRGATINRATIEFRPTGRPADPFSLEADISSQAVRLLADPFEYGEKTPIGSTLGVQQLFRPDSLASGKTMRYDITSLIRLWSEAPANASPSLRVGIVATPESRQFGFWEFFSREDGPGLRPVVHLLFTPNPSFLLP